MRERGVLPMPVAVGFMHVKELIGKKLVVLFGSNMSTCMSFADRLANKFSDMGVD